MLITPLKSFFQRFNSIFAVGIGTGGDINKFDIRIIDERNGFEFSSAFATDHEALARVTDVVVKHREHKTGFVRDR